MGNGRRRLRNAIEEMGVPFVINEGDGAFYAEADFHLQDSIGRTWQCGTIQLDMQMPQRFDLTYVDQTVKTQTDHDPPRHLWFD